MTDKNAFGDDDTFTFNISQCIADKSIPSVIRSLFIELRDHSYINTGKFFAELNAIDLDTLSYLAENTHPDADVSEEESDQAYEYMTLLGMALLVGEGQELTMESSEIGLRLAITFTTIESLYRQGLVDVFHENWTMDQHCNKPIVAKKDL